MSQHQLSGNSVIGRGQAKHFELVMLLSFDNACVGIGKCILNTSGLQDCSSFFFFFSMCVGH